MSQGETSEGIVYIGKVSGKVSLQQLQRKGDEEAEKLLNKFFFSFCVNDVYSSVWAAYVWGNF